MIFGLKSKFFTLQEAFDTSAGTVPGFVHIINMYIYDFVCIEENIWNSSKTFYP